MMYNSPHMLGMGSGWVMILLSLGVLAIALVGLFAWNPPRPGRLGAEQVLADRFARGEIDAEEYQQRLYTLRGAGH
ncbi:SHOCT domain-containing protein [Actinoplanes awajinensis]|nr:SHOCT domain-containing protein [Actinoplanes awajinensis]